jgi:hypothetical protein
MRSSLDWISSGVRTIKSLPLLFGEFYITNFTNGSNNTNKESFYGIRIIRHIRAIRDFLFPETKIVRSSITDCHYNRAPITRLDQFYQWNFLCMSGVYPMDNSDQIMKIPEVRIKEIQVQRTYSGFEEVRCTCYGTLEEEEINAFNNIPMPGIHPGCLCCTAAGSGP